MTQYEVIINYSKSGAKDVGMLINEVRQKSKPPSKQKNKDSDRITSEKSEEEKYEHQHNLAEDKINSFLEQEDFHSNMEKYFQKDSLVMVGSFE